jgi:hypothetical protein
MTILPIFNFNPVNLSTATHAWKHSSGFSKVTNALKGAAYDIYAKNPYDLTIGNLQKAATRTPHLNALDKVAITSLILIGTCFSAMICGGSLYAFGAQTLSFAKAVESPILTTVAKTSTFYGEKLFLAGAVPLYAVSYELPRYLIKNAPKALSYIVEKIRKTANWTFSNIIKPIWDQAIYPTLNFAYTQISKAIDTACDIISKLSTYLFKNIIKPLWDKAIYPALNFVFTQISRAIDKACDIISKVSIYAFENIIKPVFKGIEQASVWLAGKVAPVLKSISNAIEKVTIFLLENLIKPAFTALSTAFSWTTHKIGVALNRALIAISNVTNLLLREVIAPGFKALYQGLSFIATKTALIARSIFNAVISPVIDKICYAGKKLLDYIIKPIAKCLYSLLEQGTTVTKYALTILYNKAVVPVSQALGQLFTEVALKTYHLIEKAHTTLQELFPKFA